MVKDNIVKETWIDILTALSCVAVVYLHVNGIFWSHPKGFLWISSNIIECLFYFAVPVFFMITGYKFCDYRNRYNTTTFLKKRMYRAFIPFIIWSIFFHIKKAHSINGLFLGIVNTSIVSIYWFFPALFVCYLAIVFLSLLPNKIFIYKWLFLWAFITYSVLPIMRQFGINISEVYGTPVSGGQLLFILLGYILGKTDIKKSYRISLYILGLLGLLIHCIGTIYFTPDDGEINKIFKGYRNFPSVFYASAIFIFAKYHDWSFFDKNKIAKYCLTKIVSCSLGIYLFHHYFVYYKFPKIFSKLGYSEFAYSELWRSIGPIIIVFILCTLLCLIGKIIPQKWFFIFGITSPQKNKENYKNAT